MKTSNAKILIGTVVVPMILILLGLLYTKIINDKVQDGGTYVIARGLSWEPSEDMNGLLSVEIKYGGIKYLERVGGCREGISKYFLVLFNKDRFLKKVLFNCADSISSETIQNNPDITNTSWKDKPNNLISKKTK